MNVFKQGLARYLNPDQIEKITSKRIGIGGAGGLGSNIAMILTRCGFEQIEILDHDIIEPSNLNRQQYNSNEVGLYKVDVIHEKLTSINSDVNLTTYNDKWSLDNADQFFNNCHFIIEAFDQADNKHKFVQYYQPKTEFMISGNGMAGLTEKKPMRVQKVKNIYIVGDGLTNTEDGHPPMAPRVTACAALMAELVLDLTLNLKPIYL